MTKDKSKNPVLTTEALVEKMAGQYASFNQPNHLACTLVVTSYLEDCLRTILRNYFDEHCTTADQIFDYDTKGVLTDISSRAKVARCLALIDSLQFDTLMRIMHIRNLFAHTHPERTFDDPEISEWCNNLKFPPISGTEIDVAAGTPAKAITQESFEAKYNKPQSRFIGVASLLTLRLIGTAHAVKRCNAKPDAAEVKPPVKEGQE